MHTTATASVRTDRPPLAVVTPLAPSSPNYGVYDPNLMGSSASSPGVTPQRGAGGGSGGGTGRSGVGAGTGAGADYIPTEMAHRSSKGELVSSQRSNGGTDVSAGRGGGSVNRTSGGDPEDVHLVIEPARSPRVLTPPRYSELNQPLPSNL